MMPLRTRRGRRYPLLVLVAAVLVMASTLAGVAWGTPTSTTLATTSDSQTASFTVSAKELGVSPAVTPKITSPSAIVVNLGTGKVLYQWNANVRRPMASTTKIMTAILVLEQMDLSQSVTVSERAAKTIEPATWLKTGDTLTVEQLLYGLLVHSGNSAAVALAEASAGDVDSFVAKMNDKAAELGMDDTHFLTPNGLDKTGQYSTAADMAKVARYAMKNETFRKIVSTGEYTLNIPGRTKPLLFENTNKLLGRVDWVTGVKTGLTPRADQCLVASGTKDGVSVISVVLGQPSTNVCWTESQTLMEYGFSQYRHVTILEKGAVVAEASVPYQLDGALQLVTKDPVEMELYKDDAVTTKVTLDGPLQLPVKQGDSFGRVALTVAGQEVGSVDLVATASVGRTTLATKIGYYWHRLGRWLGEIV